jgi:hypothetical protein
LVSILPSIVHGKFATLFCCNYLKHRVNEK